MTARIIVEDPYIIMDLLHQKLLPIQTTAESMDKVRLGVAVSWDFLKVKPLHYDRHHRFFIFWLSRLMEQAILKHEIQSQTPEKGKIL